MSSIDEKIIKKYYEVALNIVKKCGIIMREGYSKVQADYKVKSLFYDLVTVYDKQIEDLIIADLQSEFPESMFMGEEQTAANNSQEMLNLTDAPTWIIDPIDGTTNFIHKIPHCCISVGLAINKELLVGIVYNAITDEMYSAWKGHGAYLNGERIQVSKCEKVNEAVLGFEISLIHAAHVRDKLSKRCFKLASNCVGTRSIGSAALSLCLVAKGSFDCYHVEDLAPWDIAGGAVILREAGGVLYHTSGKSFNIMKPDLICAATEELFKGVKQLVEEADHVTNI